VQRILFLTVTVHKVAHGPFVSKLHSADIFRVNPYTFRDPGRQPYARTRRIVKVVTQNVPYSPNSAMLLHIRRIQSSNLDPQTSYPAPSVSLTPTRQIPTYYLTPRFQSHHFQFTLGRVMAHADSHVSLTSGVRTSFQPRACGIFRGHSSIGAGFPQRTPGFPCQCHFTNAPRLYFIY